MKQDIDGVEIGSAEVSKDLCVPTGMCVNLSDAFTTDDNDYAEYDEVTANTDDILASNVAFAAQKCPVGAIALRAKDGQLIPLNSLTVKANK